MSRLKIGNRKLNVDFGAMIFELSFTEVKDCELLLFNGLEYNCNIDWGDGSEKTYLNETGTDNLITHEYDIGTYYLKIYGEFQGLNFNNTDSKSSIDYITKILSWGKPETTNLIELILTNITSLISLPNERGGLKNVISFHETFKNCTSLTTIPSGSFDNNNNVAYFTRTFYGCTSLTTIPSGLFDNTNVTSFSGAFYGCTSLTTIPSGLFDNNTNVTSFSGAFHYCSSLTTIPSDLFDNNTNVTSFQETFKNCTSLTEVAPRLWDNTIWTEVTSFDYCFTNTNTLGTSGANIPSTWGGSSSCDPMTNCTGL